MPQLSIQIHPLDTAGKQEIFLGFFEFLVPRNITQIYSLVRKPTKVKVIKEYMPGTFLD
jgi:hypothetical protein